MNSTARIETLEEKQSTIQNDNQTLKAAYEHLNTYYWHVRKIQQVLPICIECGRVKTTDSTREDVDSF